MLRSIAAWIRALLLLSIGTVFISCGGGGGSSSLSPSGGMTQNITVTVTPASATIDPGGTQLYTATVTGTSNISVTWSAGGVQGGNSTAGTISSSGLYTAPAVAPNPSSVTITAVSTADSTKSGTATANIRVHHDNQDPQSGPIKLGTSGGNSTDTTRSGNQLFCCSGTLGSLVSRAGTLYVLSNNHVLNKSDQGAVGDPISQPGLADSNCGTAGIRTVANMSQAAALKTSNVDAAIAQIVTGQVDTSGTILDLAAPGQPAQPSAITGLPAINQAVAKSGDASGLTCSTVTATNALIRVTYSTSCQGGTNFDVTYNNQVAIAGANFSNSGDSGSLIVDSSNSRPVALLYAGSNTGTVGNPIQDVYNALKDSNGVTPQVVGGSDHPVACPAGLQLQPGSPGPQEKRGLPQSEISRATLARNHRMYELMQDSAVDTVEVGRSADNPDESAVVVTLRGLASLPIPAQVDGVRTRIVENGEFNALHPQAKQAAALSPISETEVARARGAKQQHAEELMTNSAIIGVGVGASNGSPGEAAIVVFVEKGKSVAVPAVIDGVRTRVIATDPFRTFNWGKSTVKACSRK